MLKSQMPNLPGVGVMTDTLDFVKNLWGSMGVPGVTGMAVPTLSVEDLDKKIADLKAVESWLAINTSMLRGTIQALEVQRGTIATLKSMGASLAAAVSQPGANDKSVLDAAPYLSAFFSQARPGQAEAAPASAAPEKPLEEAAPAPSPAAAAAAPMTNPWWNMLQDQFKQAVTTAMKSDAMAGASAIAQDAAAKFSAAASAALPAAEPGKAVNKTLPKQPEAKAPAKRAPAKPKAATAKPKPAKS